MRAGMVSGSPHIAGKGLCLITVGLDLASAETVQQIGAGETIQHVTALADYVQGRAPASVAGQADDSEMLVCLVDFDKKPRACRRIGRGPAGCIWRTGHAGGPVGRRESRTHPQCHARRLYRVSPQAPTA